MSTTIVVPPARAALVPCNKVYYPQSFLTQVTVCVTQSSPHLIEIIDSLSAVAGPLEVHVHVDAAGHDELPRGVDGPGAAGDDEVIAHEPDHAILTERQSHYLDTPSHSLVEDED